MGLSVIGAGFGRTGTMSMKLALETLGLGPCHHMQEVMASPGQKALWRAAARGEVVDWDQAFAGYGSALDWPAAYFWRQLSAYYPDSKILLTVRSAESWYESISNTLLKTLESSTDPDSIGLRMVAEGVFGGRLGDRAHAIAVYEKNNAEVQATIPHQRLLTYHLGDGWQPLCRFLDKPIPKVPFPRTNSTEEFKAMFAEMNSGESQ